MTATQSQTSREEAAARVAAFGRKLVDEDLMLNAQLKVFALSFIKTYEGENHFVHDLARRLKGGKAMSLGQLRGALNVFRNELPKPEREKEEVADETSFARIKQLFDTAATHLKWPKVRLLTEGDGPVVLSVAGPKSRVPGTINVTSAGSFYERQYFGRVLQDGKLEKSTHCPVAVVELLKKFAADPAGVAAEYGKLTGYCCFCQATLTDERSTAVGYGPVCADHYGLPWGRKEVAA